MSAADIAELDALSVSPSLATFFDNLDSFADVPQGVAKLRELILDLAVRGKLVEQDENDEPASVSLKRVEKERLVKDSNRLRKLTLPLPPTADEVPHDLPNGWEWTRLSIIGDVGPRNKVDDEMEVSFLPMATISDGYAGTIAPKVRPWGEIKKGFTHVADGDIVMAKITPCFQNRKSAVMRGLKNGVGAGTTELFVLRPVDNVIVPEYTILQLKSLTFLEVGVSRMTGSAGQKRVPREYFADTPFPLPPLAEQRRIVSKVDQLMSLCDELETRGSERVRVRERASRSCLDRLVVSSSANDLASAWQRLSDHFEVLYDAPETIADLRQSILQLAVQGRLVPQDQNDEPASELVKKIDAKRARLLKEKAIRTTKEPPAIDEAEMEHTIPGAWSWARLANICELITDGTHYTPKYTDSGRMFLSAQNVKPFEFMPKSHRFVSEEDYRGYVKNAKPEYEDVLLTRVGAGIGEAAVIDQRLDFAIYVSLGLVRPVKEFVYPRYIELWLNSPSGRQHSERNTYGKGVSQGNLNLGLIRSFAIPLPPLAEQKRIVAKVDQLLSQSDELSARLRERQSATQQLLTATIHHLLEASETET